MNPRFDICRQRRRILAKRQRPEGAGIAQEPFPVGLCTLRLRYRPYARAASFVVAAVLRLVRTPAAEHLEYQHETATRQPDLMQLERQAPLPAAVQNVLQAEPATSRR